jgi:hypothetical protein
VDPTYAFAYCGLSDTYGWRGHTLPGVAGAGLREIARKMNIPEGTVLAHAKRKGWAQQIEAAKQEARPTQS